MSDIVIIVYLVFLGLCFGSFINALVWRLHEKRDFVKERSECVHCHHVLAWYDLIPVISWLMLGGKCRYCKKPISYQYPLVEALTTLLFVGSYLWWPFELTVLGWALLVLWLVFIVAVVALAVYDIRWMLLPDVIVFPLIALGGVFGAVKFLGIENLTILQTLYELALGAASIGGVYYVLYKINNNWVGFGDVKLGVFMGLVLGWQAGLLALVLANVIGLLIILPGLVTKKLERTSRVPFGPFLIAGFLIAGLFSEGIISWYLSTIL